MPRSVAIFFGSVTVIVTCILFFQTLGVNDKIKTSVGKLLDKVPKVVYSIVSVVCACFALYYLTTDMVRKGPSLEGLVYVAVISAAAMLDMYLSDVLTRGRQ